MIASVRMALLLVEDEEADRALIEGMFRRAQKLATRATSAHIQRATNLLEAGHVLETAPPGSLTVLLDLSLADATEQTTLDWIRRHAPLFAVIVLTGNDDEAFPEKALRAGAQDYLVKWDFNADALTRAILYAAERHRTQNELRRAKDAAEAASRAKSQFLANMSHEIRTPLGAMLGAVELLVESPLDPEQRRHVDMLGKAGRHLRELIDGILDLAKIEAGGIVLERVAFSVGELLSGIEELLGPSARAKGLRLSCVAPGERTLALGDPTRLKQVMLNLVGNAIKFTDRGDISVHAARDAAGDVMRFTVADTGVGIAPEQLSRIFGAFTQADASTTRLHGGTGLGLAIARQLVALMGGQLEVQSTVGAGSRFTFEVPLPPAARPRAASGPVTPAWTSLAADGPAAGRPVLIADDAEENRVLLARFLQGAPFEIIFATHGTEALEEYRHRNPGLVLLDLHMPRMDGIEVASRIRAMEAAARRPPVPLIALTADAFNQTRDRCLAAGFTTFLAKPVPRATLRQTIAGLLRSQLAARLAPPDIDVDVDIDAGLDLVDEDLRDLLPEYIENRLIDAEAIRAAVTTRDLDLVAQLAHRMKGSGATYGLPVVTELGARIETAARQGRADLLPGEVDRLGRELIRIRDHLGPPRP